MKKSLEYFLAWFVVLSSIGVFVLYGFVFHYLAKNNHVSYENKTTYNEIDAGEVESEIDTGEVESEIITGAKQLDNISTNTIKEQNLLEKRSLLSDKDQATLESLGKEKEEDSKYLKESIYTSLKDIERFKMKKVLELEEKAGEDPTTYYEKDNLIGMTKYILMSMLNEDIGALEDVTYMRSNLPKLLEKVKKFKPYKDNFGEFIICPLLDYRVYVSYTVNGKVKAEASIDFVKTGTNFYFSHLNF